MIYGKQINLLRKQQTFPKNALTMAGIAFILASVSHPTRITGYVKIQKPLHASEVISPFVAAPLLSRADRLESDLKSLTLAERSLKLSRVGSNGIEIVLPSDSVFEPGSASFAGKLEPELRNLVQWISARNEGFQLTIESHTDDTPIVKHRKAFRTNWDLSAARAGAVAGVFQESSFPKNRLQAVGLADSRPLGSDRNQNRRIVLRFTDSPRGGT